MTITMYGDLRRKPLLSLARYTQLMGIDPIRFFGGYSSLRPNTACDDTWFEYTWQDGGKVSREEILLEILKAEQEIADFIGFWPAPRWISSEPYSYPQFFEPGYRGTGGRTYINNKAIKLDYGYVHYGGIRATTLIETATRGDDIDTTGDGYADMAVWVVTGVTYTPTQIKAYIKPYDALDVANCRTDPESYGADESWEIRDMRIQHDSATNIATVYIPRYQMLKPQLQRIINVSALSVDTPANFVDDLVFYRVYNNAATQVQFLWTSDESCASVSCAWSAQDGCIQVSDSRLGSVFLSPGTYDTETDTYTAASAWTQCIDPHKVLVSYYSGYIDEFTRSVDQLSTFFANQIAKLATSRIPRRFCNCENIQQLVDRWQEDTARASTERSYITALDLANPFGSRVGEIEVYRALKRYGLRVKRGVNTYL